MREALGDQRAVAGLGVGLDAQQRRGRAVGHLGDERVEVGVVEDLAHVALGVLRVEQLARALADAEAVVGGVLQPAQLGRRRELAVVAVGEVVRASAACRRTALAHA